MISQESINRIQKEVLEYCKDLSIDDILWDILRNEETLYTEVNNVPQIKMMDYIVFCEQALYRLRRNMELLKYLLENNNLSTDEMHRKAYIDFVDSIKKAGNTEKTEQEKE